jgi:P4 family phage/plasmid primase-like protien
MSDDSGVAALAAALQPLISRVRTDVTAVKKPTGEQAWTRQPLTPERLARHLNGGPPRGVAPLKPGEDITLVAMLDFDSHGGEVSWLEMSRVVRRVSEHLELLGYDSTIWRSSGGRGVHLYLLWDIPQPARAVRAFLTDSLRALGLKNGTRGVGENTVEIFPKQDKVPVGGFGNQFILPFANKSELLRWEDMLDEYVPVPRSKVAATSWVCAPSVPNVSYSGHEPEVLSRIVDISTGEVLWRAALDAIPNTAANDLDYDAWRNVIFAIHHETKGSEEGRAIAHAFSKRSPKYDAEFLDNRVWPYITSERGGHVVTGRTLMSIASRYGWFAPIEDEFTAIPDPDSDHDPDDPADQSDPVPGVVAAVGSSSSDVAAGGSGSGGARVGQIPQAQGITSDQANANRLARAYGRKLFASAGRWYAYDGQRWAPDESPAYIFGCNLGRLISEEAAERERAADVLQAAVDEKITESLNIHSQMEALDKNDVRRSELNQKSVDAMPSPEEREAVVLEYQVAEKLHKWAAKSEMKGTIEAALTLLRKIVTLDPDALDADPMLFNCMNGTIDLMSGDLRPHRAKDYLTKLSPVEFKDVENFDCSNWERIVRDITGDDAVARFLQRWFGYCATASIKEQVLVVHWGTGRNGKSTVLETVMTVLGGYASTAAPGLLTNDGKGFDRHPTEVASLLGSRMVVAHESEDGAALREGFVKQATGGDRLKGRYMREDFFEFMPKHKLQLLTNHKPQIKGTDPGIWRRVILVPYTQSFGTHEQFEAGMVTHVADKNLGESIKRDPRMLQQVLVWIVRGAMEWAQRGLGAPDSVLAASRSYQEEQDRVGQFVRECCEVAPPDQRSAWMEPLTQGMSGLYPAYQSWAKDSGLHPLGRQKFIESLRSTVPGCEIKEGHTTGERRRKITKVFGIRLLQEE